MQPRGLDDILKQQASISGVDSLDALLRRSSLVDKISLELMQADVSVRVGEYMLVRLALALALGGGVFLLNGPLLVLPFVLLGFYLPKIDMGCPAQGVAHQSTAWTSRRHALDSGQQSQGRLRYNLGSGERG